MVSDLPNHVCSSMCRFESCNLLFVCLHSGHSHFCGENVCTEAIRRNDTWVCRLTQRSVSYEAQLSDADYHLYGSAKGSGPDDPYASYQAPAQMTIVSHHAAQRAVTSAGRPGLYGMFNIDPIAAAAVIGRDLCMALDQIEREELCQKNSLVSRKRPSASENERPSAQTANPATLWNQALKHFDRTRGTSKGLSQQLTSRASEILREITRPSVKRTPQQSQTPSGQASGTPLRPVQLQQWPAAPSTPGPHGPGLVSPNEARDTSNLRPPSLKKRRTSSTASGASDNPLSFPLSSGTPIPSLTVSTIVPIQITPMDEQSIQLAAGCAVRIWEEIQMVPAYQDEVAHYQFDYHCLAVFYQMLPPALDPVTPITRPPHDPLQLPRLQSLKGRLPPRGSLKDYNYAKKRFHDTTSRLRKYRTHISQLIGTQAGPHVR
jgi:hypothetical protein